MKNEANPAKIPSLECQIRDYRSTRIAGTPPDDDVPFIFHHEKVHVMVFTHKRMWNEVQENIRKQSTRLERSRVSHPDPTIWANVIGPKTGQELTANAVMVFNVSALICAGINARMKFGTL